ncbi:unnamed protein product [Calypogeia fissa]
MRRIDRQEEGMRKDFGNWRGKVTLLRLKKEERSQRKTSRASLKRAADRERERKENGTTQRVLPTDNAYKSRLCVLRVRLQQEKPATDIHLATRVEKTTTRRQNRNFGKKRRPTPQEKDPEIKRMPGWQKPNRLPKGGGTGPDQDQSGWMDRTEKKNYDPPTKKKGGKQKWTTIDGPELAVFRRKMSPRPHYSGSPMDHL